MTQQEFDDIVKATCPHCAKGYVPRRRQDTGEYVHDFVQPTGAPATPIVRQGHSICMATHFRNSKLAEVTDG